MINKKNIYGLPFTNTFINSSTKTIYMENIFAQNLQVRNKFTSHFIDLLDGSINNVESILNLNKDITIQPKELLSLLGNLNLNYYNIINVSEIKSEADIVVDTSNLIASNDLIVNNDLYVYGTVKTVGDAALGFNNNLIQLNNAQTGIPDTSLNSGLQINRGDLPGYNILYEEKSQSLKAGYDDNLQTVAFREDYPINNAIVVWDELSKSFITTRGSFINLEDQFYISNKLLVDKDSSFNSNVYINKDLNIKKNLISSGVIENNSGVVASKLGDGSDMFPEHSTNKLLISNLVGEFKYKGGVLAPNGKIYCVPYMSNDILVINPKDNTISFINIPYNGYSGGVISKNRKIYCTPFTPDNNKILVINTDYDNFYYLEINNIINDYQWSSSVIYENKIFFIPYCHNDILIINTIDNSISYISYNNINDISNNKWSGGILAPNGKIFCIPYNSNYIAIIDPEELNIETIYIDNINYNQKWNSGVLAQNGYIFCIPSNSDKILKINTYDNTYSFIDINNENIPDKWYGGTLSTNGLIYMMPYNSDKLLIIDPNTDLYLIKNNIGNNNNDWVGSILVPNGKIYGIPCNNTSVLIIKTGYPQLLNWMISPEFNKL